MRTTLTLDDDVLAAARAIARERDASLGKVVSDLLRRALQPRPALRTDDALPTFNVPNAAKVFGPDEVARALETA